MKGNKSGSSKKKRIQNCHPPNCYSYFCCAFHWIQCLTFWFISSLPLLIHVSCLGVCDGAFAPYIFLLKFVTIVCESCLSISLCINVFLCVVRGVDDVNSHNYGRIVLAAYAFADAKRDTEFVCIWFGRSVVRTAVCILLHISFETKRNPTETFGNLVNVRYMILCDNGSRSFSLFHLRQIAVHLHLSLLLHSVIANAYDCCFGFLFSVSFRITATCVSVHLIIVNSFRFNCISFTATVIWFQINEVPATTHAHITNIVNGTVKKNGMHTHSTSHK